VPINRKHPIDELLAACWHYIDKQNGRSVTFEYVMLDGINDKPEHARALARLLARPPGQAQFDPVQCFPGTRYRCSPAAGDAQVPRYSERARRDRDHPAHARRRHRCGVRAARGAGHRSHPGAARREDDAGARGPAEVR
jgi:adenine C2-methylase RlmN of 23S rRNA A2503 and tRNA A37